MVLCLSPMLSIASSHKKKHENLKNFRHIEIIIFTYFFVNRFFRTRYEKKENSRYNTQKIRVELLKFL